MDDNTFECKLIDRGYNYLFKNREEYNHEDKSVVIKIQADSKKEAFRKLIINKIFLEYIGCVYRERFADDRIIDPNGTAIGYDKKICGTYGDKSVCHKYYKLMEEYIDNIYDGKYDIGDEKQDYEQWIVEKEHEPLYLDNSYALDNKQIELANIVEENLNEIEIATLKAYSEAKLKWLSLCSKLESLYDFKLGEIVDNQVKFSNEEIDSLYYVEVTNDNTHIQIEQC